MGPKRPREEEEKVIEVEGAKLVFETAKSIVDAAIKEANDVMETMKDPEKNKKPKQLKATTREDVIRCVMSGEPTTVLHHIKGHKKEFISGVYSSVFMSAIRKEMSGEGTTKLDGGEPKKAKTDGDEAKAAESKEETANKSEAGESKNGAAADETAG